MKLAERTENQVALQGRSPPPTRRPGALWPLLVITGLLSLGGFVGGLSFVGDPSGASLGAKLSWLEKAPVDDFFLPGLFLLVVYGIGCLVLLAGLIWRFSPGPMRRLDRWLGHHWSWEGTILVGVVLVAWIFYEFTIFADRTPLQPILIVVGALMVAIPLFPSNREYFTTSARR